MSDLKALPLKLQKWDESIKQGELDQVRTDLANLVITEVDRSDRLRLASICRRVQLYDLAIKVLFPTIRSDEIKSLTSHEIAEYCASLICIGSFMEAKALLAKAATEECPEVLLSRGFLEMMAWNFDKAVEWLSQYLNSPNLTDYQVQVASVNLASSLVGIQKYDEALKLLTNVLKQAQAHSYGLVYTTGLCHLAGLYLELKDHSAARATIDLARRKVPQSDFQHHLLLDKIRAKLGAETGAQRVTVQLFDQIKMRALQNNMYEVARDCDFSKVKWFGDKQALLAAYVGTTLPSFRKKFFGLGVGRPIGAYVVRSDAGIIDAFEDSPPSSFELMAPQGLREGEMIHRLLAALHRDFYRPLTMGETFEVLFPENYFNPFTSPLRLNQVIRRARAWLKGRKYPITIGLDKRGLTLRNSPAMPIHVLTDRQSLTRSPMEQALIRAFEKFGNERFQMEDLINHIGCTKGQAWPYLREALEKGILGKTGSARYTFYFFIRPLTE